MPKNVRPLLTVRGTASEPRRDTRTIEVVHPTTEGASCLVTIHARDDGSLEIETWRIDGTVRHIHPEEPVDTGVTGDPVYDHCHLTEVGASWSTGACTGPAHGPETSEDGRVVTTVVSAADVWSWIEAHAHEFEPEAFAREPDGRITAAVDLVYRAAIRALR